jgi:hypothetical protein
MPLHSTYTVFAIGAAGGAALEMLHWYALRRDRRLPAYATSPLYWLITLAMIALGGLIAILYFGSRAEALLAFHVGASTPLILQKLTTTVVREPGAKSLDASPMSFLNW